MFRISRLLFGCSFVVVVCAVVIAGGNGGYRFCFPRIISSPSGSLAVKVIPRGTAAKIVMFSLDETGSDIVSWESQIDFIPGRILVSIQGQFCSLGAWGFQGGLHALTLVDSKGKVIAQRALEDILNADEISTHTMRTSAGRIWLQEIEPAFVERSGAQSNLEASDLRLRCAWGVDIIVNGVTGEIHRETMPAANQKSSSGL